MASVAPYRGFQVPNTLATIDMTRLTNTNERPPATWSRLAMTGLEWTGINGNELNWTRLINNRIWIRMRLRILVHKTEHFFVVQRNNFKK